MKEDLKRIAIRLRINHRMSIREIRKILPVAQSTLSLWLRDTPLNEKEIRKKRSEKMKGNKHRQKDQGHPSKHYRGVAHLSRKDKGRISESAVLFRLALHGYEVYGQEFGNQSCDWLVVTPSGVKRLEVRWASQKKDGLPIISLQKSNGRGGSKRAPSGSFDVLVGYDLYSDTAYVFTSKEITHLSTGVSVSPESAERWDKL
jgi:hypothetical protein